MPTSEQEAKSQYHQQSAESRRVDAYLETVKRLEPDLTMIDRDYAMASIAISLKRIADALEGLRNRVAF